ncbi:MAG: hypothetical protein ACE5GN_05930 [Waddliaceae bacterium]
MNALATNEAYQSEKDFEETSSASRTKFSEVVPFNWQAVAQDKLHELERLPVNWNSYGSIPPTQTVLLLARILFFSYLGDRDMPHPDLSPVSGGGIQIEWYKEGRELELEIFPDGHFEFLRVEHDEPLEEGPASLSNIYSLISWLLHE